MFNTLYVVFVNFLNLANLFSALILLLIPAKTISAYSIEYLVIFQYVFIPAFLLMLALLYSYKAFKSIYLASVIKNYYPYIKFKELYYLILAITILFIVINWAMLIFLIQ